MVRTPRELILARLEEAGFASSRVKNAVDWEFRDWSVEEVDMLLRQMKPLGTDKGSENPAGLSTIGQPRLLITSCLQ